MKFSVCITKLGIILIVLSTFQLGVTNAQELERVKIMQYNLLNYGVSPNTPAYKNPRFQTIVNYVQPDILGVNEVARGQNNPITFLNDVLGAGWAAANYTNTVNSQQVNMLFWKTEKFGLKQQTSICNLTRDIIWYTLFYKDALLNGQQDTAFLNIIVAHLKAGSTQEDELARANETQCLINYLNTNTTGGNFIFMGDLNVYTAAEPCYQNLTAGSGFRFYDPINRPGNWHSNSSFKDLHVQSTRSTSLADGGASGGLDDRFTQILISGEIVNNTRNIQYIANSYNSIGQDGNHYQKAINSSPMNTAAPANVIQALYEGSDHLPVTADFHVKKIGEKTHITSVDITATTHCTVVNPIINQTLTISLNTQIYAGRVMKLELMDMFGQVVFSKEQLLQAGQPLSIPFVKPITPGSYVLKILDGVRFLEYQKIIVL